MKELPPFTLFGIENGKQFSFFGSQFTIEIVDDAISAVATNNRNTDMLKGDVNYFSISRYSGQLDYMPIVGGKVVQHVRATCVNASKQFWAMLHLTK